MTVKSFQFLGGKEEEAFELDLAGIDNVEALQRNLGPQLGVVQPHGLSFHDSSGRELEWEGITSAVNPLTIKVDGHAIRDVPGPAGLTWVGNYFEIFPDHLGNLQRLFGTYGSLLKTTNMGVTNYFTNDPRIITIALSESEFFSKQLVPSHPLYPIKNQKAGVFLADTSSPAWAIVHKFLPPALGPKAVRHYAPAMNGCIEEAIQIFDQLELDNKGWNVYQYMLKVSSSTVAKIVLGKDVNHFSSIDAPLDRLILAIAESLALMKKIANRGEWYSQLPFGDPQRLRELSKVVVADIGNAIDKARTSGEENLPLQDAALKSANVVDYLTRATDSHGARLPKENLISAVTVAAGAGFTTTSSLLSWCIYGMVTYPEVQARLLQELVDHDITDKTNITADQVDDLLELDKYVKEMQRRHNPAFQPARTAQRDMILPGGYRLPKESVVVSAIHHVHNNPAVWDNPDQFDPDRWDTAKVKARPKGSYIPFAQGQRMCIGFNFALLEVKIFIIKLVYRYHWDKEGETATEYDPFFQLIRPVNLYVRTQKREHFPSKSDQMQ